MYFCEDSSSVFSVWPDQSTVWLLQKVTIELWLRRAISSSYAYIWELSPLTAVARNELKLHSQLYVTLYNVR